MKLLELNDQQSSYEHIAGNILASCKPFLELIDYDTDQYQLYRGAKGTINPVTILPGYRDNRKPRDTPTHLHAAINRVFKATFGVPFRNGIFTTGKKSDAESYGSTLYVVIPIGDFKFIWSHQIVDLFDYFRRKVRDDFGVYDDINGNNPKVIGTLLKYVDTPEFVNLYQDTAFRAAVVSGHEVMLYSEHCYYIKVTEYQLISNAIKLIHSHSGSVS